MAVQKELVDQGMLLSDTGAGRVVELELRMAAERHRAEMKKVKTEMEDAMRELDQRTQRELAEWQEQAEAEEAKRKSELDSMRKGFSDEQARWEKHIQEAKANHEAVQAQHAAQEASEELEAVRREREADENHRKYLHDRIAELERQFDDKPGCIVA